SKNLFDKIELAIRRAYTILTECPCENEDGCPRCTYSYRCGNNNEYLHKKAAIEVISRIIKGEKIKMIDIDPFQRTLI
ncbi:MAG TPA: hypothetical protein VFK40_00810, partial [Nitrososphaeraceae archaeon]|nr:hypothetical protein [Nitrososphaeraceae archaeon]